MTAFANLPVNIAAGSGNNPQIVTPQGWALSGAGVGYVENPGTVYGASIVVDLALGNWIFITANANIGAWTLAAPLYKGAALSATNVPIGMPILVTIRNTSGGAIGAFSQTNPPWRGVGGFGAPAAGQYIAAPFIVRSATEIVGMGNWMTAIAY